jgi:hypothetical protein
MAKKNRESPAKIQPRQRPVFGTQRCGIEVLRESSSVDVDVRVSRAGRNGETKVENKPLQATPQANERLEGDGRCSH